MFKLMGKKIITSLHLKILCLSGPMSYLALWFQYKPANILVSSGLFGETCQCLGNRTIFLSSCITTGCVIRFCLIIVGIDHLPNITKPLHMTQIPPDGISNKVKDIRGTLVDLRVNTPQHVFCRPKKEILHLSS